MIHLSKKQKILCATILLIILFILGGYVWYTSNSPNDYMDLEEPETMMKNTTNTVNTATSEEVIMIVIHVTGSIKKPGIVKIKENSRISDAIDAARRIIRGC